MTEESTEEYFERNYFKELGETNHRDADSFYTNLFLAQIVDRLTALSYQMSELNSNLSNINHNIADLKSKEEEDEY